MGKLHGWLLIVGSALQLAACTHPQSSSLEPVVRTPATTLAEQIVTKPADESLTIAFPMAGATLSPEANSQLDGAARLYRDAGPEIMTISGHSDKTGEEFANLILSARRADMVKKALVDRGIPAERLQIVADGAAELVAGVPASRSAIVTWR